MSRRGWLAMAVLLLWSATIGWHVKRLYFRAIEEIVTDAARRIPPGAAYYVVEQEGRRVGWSQSRVDTLPSHGGFRIRDRLEATIMAGGQPVPTTLVSEAELGPALQLRRFTLRSRGILGDFLTSGETRGDSLLLLVLRRGARTDTVRLTLEGPVILSTAWPLRFVAQSERRPGRRFRIPLFDPVTGSTRPVDLEILAEATRTYADSATDAGPLWVEAREDTVRAWLVERDLAGLKFRSWIDEDGRLLEAEMPGGFRIRRTAFELAFYGDSVPGWTPGGAGENAPGGAPDAKALGGGAGPEEGSP